MRFKWSRDQLSFNESDASFAKDSLTQVYNKVTAQKPTEWDTQVQGRFIPSNEEQMN